MLRLLVVSLWVSVLWIPTINADECAGATVKDSECYWAGAKQACKADFSVVKEFTCGKDVSPYCCPDCPNGGLQQGWTITNPDCRMRAGGSCGAKCTTGFKSITEKQGGLRCQSWGGRGVPHSPLAVSSFVSMPNGARDKDQIRRPPGSPNAGNTSPSPSLGISPPKVGDTHTTLGIPEGGTGPSAALPAPSLPTCRMGQAGVSPSGPHTM